MKKRKTIKEGKVRKGGVNTPPTTERPPKPVGQAGTFSPDINTDNFQYTVGTQNAYMGI